MPPRVDHHLAPDALAFTAYPSAPSSKRKSRPKISLGERQLRPRILFKNTHGISGVFSASLTMVAIVAQHVLPSNSLAASTTSVVAAVASIITASSGASIVDQAPIQTVVMEYPIKVIPPHRDAFRRTAYSVYYLGARICWNTTKMHFHLDGHSSTGEYGNAISWLWSCFTLLYAIKYFIPRPKDVDWTNGNTYVFVVPMAIGLTGDALCQLPILQCQGEICWNDDIVAQYDLLCILLSGLIVAFVFTLAFRRLLGVRECYWWAALVVHGIVACLIIKAAKFIAMALPFAMAYS